MVGTRGPLPNPNAQRRNKESASIDIYDADPLVDVEEPLLTTYQREVTVTTGAGKDKATFVSHEKTRYGPDARRAWAAVWASPLAKHFRDETVEALWRWVKLVDRFHQFGEVRLNKDILTLEQQYALTWASQRRARLQFHAGSSGEAAVAASEAAAPVPAPEPVASDAERRQRIQAVGE